MKVKKITYGANREPELRPVPNIRELGRVDRREHNSAPVLCTRAWRVAEVARVEFMLASVPHQPGICWTSARGMQEHDLRTAQ
jgi:hypothetical protein